MVKNKNEENLINGLKILLIVCAKPTTLKPTTLYSLK